MDERTLDAKELIADTRTAGLTPPLWVPLAPADGLETWRRWPMKDDESLDYLHHNWVLANELDPQVTGSGLKGRLIRVIGRIVFRVLGPYLREERELIAHFVRMNDALARRVDELTKEVSIRQTKEAENQAKLAAWLDDELHTGTARTRGNHQPTN
ncbi:MAG: hypothetical protein ACRDV4_03770 [Acidimicrobiales bacterium]